MNWQEVLRKTGPAVLWTAEPMTSCHTGMRPKGESVKLHGSWWKIEPWSYERIQRHVLDRDEMTLWIQAAPSTSFASFRQDAMGMLVKAVDAALKAGMTRDQISSLVDTRLVVVIMED